MKSPTYALLWQLAWQNRWGFAISGCYLLGAAIVVQLLPRNVLSFSQGDGDLPAVGRTLGLGCSFVLLHILAVFVSSEGGLKDTGFSSQTFVLPLTARALVAGPMLAGCLAMTAAWLAISLFVARPAGIAAPLAWPAAALAFSLAALQVLSWWPLARTWMRLVLAPPVVFIVCLGVLGLAVSGASELAITAIFIALLPVAFAAAVHAVTLARRGDAYDWRLWQRVVEWAATWRAPAKQPFSSADAAQLWFEWRGQGWVLPLTIGSMLLPIMSLLILTNPGDVAAGWRSLGMLLALPIVFALFLGGQLGLQDAWSSYAASPLIAARPISTLRLIRAKLLMCAASTLAGWLVILLIVPLLLLRPGFGQSVVQAAQAIGIVRFTALAVAAIAAMIAVTWLQMAGNLWLSLTGRAWVVNGVTCVGASLAGAATLVGVWIYFHPELHGAMRAAGPWVLGLLLAAKFVLATAVTIALVRSGLTSASLAAGMLGTWALTAMTLLLIALWLVPSQYVSAADLAGGIVLLVPYSRLAGAPLALDWNRHR